ncbi:hypothetical protein B9Z55_023264 [Caenorhabditis nigoni]|uniref:Uncharacterized protein n=1 Tax=Caenorhabditis nigoni TaxID=1611254 RepID=A0A2G5SP72_9PELO|nr:hypothetical protein B9Z55_023264 [Caenorhabditis nigoni]
MDDWLIRQATDEFVLSGEQFNNLNPAAAGLPVNPVLDGNQENQENTDPNWEHIGRQQPDAYMLQLLEEVRELEEQRRILQEENRELVEELRRAEEERQARNEAYRAIELNLINEERQARDEALRAIEEYRIVREQNRILEGAVRRMEEAASVQEHQQEAHEDNENEIPNGEANRVPQDDHQRTF